MVSMNIFETFTIGAILTREKQLELFSEFFLRTILQYNDFEIAKKTIRTLKNVSKYAI